jgi:hypothetical protein
MSTRLVVDNHNELKESRLSDNPQQPLAFRQAATVISYLFHPVFIAIYVVLFLVFLHPYLFISFNRSQKIIVLLQAIVMYAFFPLVTVLLLKALRFIPSIHLENQKDRIIPLVICGIWYFWIWYVWRNLPGYPREIVVFAMASFLASSIGLMMNIYMKVSLHAISTGVLAAFMLLMGMTQAINLGLYISLALFIAGLVCTARFIVSDHTQKEVYGGLIAGAIALVAANWLA